MSLASLNGKVIVVTGGSSGIGKALVTLAVAHGACVATCGRDLQKLQTALADVPQNNLLCYAADVAVADDCNQFIQAVVNKWHRIDMLICNAGMSMRALFDAVDVKVLQQLMDINFWGAVHCIKAAMPQLLNSKGVIVGVSSIAGYRGLPGRTGYSASKFAMQGFLESLRTELLHTGTHVMWVCPGFTASNIRNSALNDTGHAQGETPLDEKSLMSAEAVATAILEAMVKRKRTLVMTRQGKLAVWVNKLFPAFADKKVFELFAKEPDSPLGK